MKDRAYHHGHLRTVLLDAAERALREHGVERLSLRDLARQTGVSHAAPRRHFTDRQALLDAVAESGFARLADEARTAIDDAGADHRARLRGAATAFVRFAIENAALLELMFTRKSGEPPAALRDASARLFTMMGTVIHDAQEAGTLPTHDPERLQLLFAATLQGIAALVTSGRAKPGQVDMLVTDAVDLFVSDQH